MTAVPHPAPQPTAVPQSPRDIAAAIVRDAARECDVSLEDILAGAKTVPVTRARWIALQSLKRAFPRWPNSRLGRQVGLTCPSSVLHALRQGTAYMATGDASLREYHKRRRLAARVKRGYPPNGSNARLTPEQVRGIKSLLADGWSMNDLAATYDVDPSTISKIKHGRTWRHVA